MRITRVEKLLGAIADLNPIPDYSEESMTRIEKLLMAIAKRSEHSRVIIETEGTQGYLTKDQMSKVLNDQNIIVEIKNNTEFYRLSSIQDSYRVYTNMDRVQGDKMDFRTMYINTDPSTVNYRSFTIEHDEPES